MKRFLKIKKLYNFRALFNLLLIELKMNEKCSVSVAGVALLGLNFLLAHVCVLIGLGQVGLLLAFLLSRWRSRGFHLLRQLRRLLLRLALRLEERCDEAEDEEALDGEGDDQSGHAARRVSLADAGEER